MQFPSSPLPSRTICPLTPRSSQVRNVLGDLPQPVRVDLELDPHRLTRELA